MRRSSSLLSAKRTAAVARTSAVAGARTWDLAMRYRLSPTIRSSCLVAEFDRRYMLFRARRLP